MKPFIYEFSGLLAEEVFAGLAAQPYSLFLDSADRNHPRARYSYIAAFPAETIEGCDFDKLQQRLEAHSKNKKITSGLPPFQGGGAGFFTYEGAMRIGIYDQIMAFDHQCNKSWLIIHETDEKTAQEKRDNFLFEKTDKKIENLALHWRAEVTPDSYKQQVQRVINYIRAGDIFQANLSQRFSADAPTNFDVYAHYLNLRRINPAPYAGFMNLDDVKIVSASPESFLSVKNGCVETRPIKGTRVRSSDAIQDEKNKQDLRSSAKDIAENIMIVDLLRSDLSKVCEAPSVEVEKLCALESFSGVHHLVSTVRGILRPNQTALDALRACFPGGSVTGAPKIRAMEILQELEQQTRGPYCGSLGYIGFNGNMETNILIRTLIYEGSKVSFRTGGGVTAQSNPEAEYQETLDKAEKIFCSFDMAPMSKSA